MDRITEAIAVTIGDVRFIPEAELDVLQSQVNHLESDRDALARQVDELRKALEMFEWDEDDYCHWCDHWKKDGHWDHCPRQKALGKA